jgi:PTS system mannose-specific IID component
VVQAAWNHERMIGVGVAHAMEPLLRDLPGGRGGEAYASALERAGQFFNAHPYLAGAAVGAVARAEHEGVAPEQVRRLRGALAGPLGSVGDKLVWAGALPVASGVGLTVAAAVSPTVGAVAFLVLYNLAHLALRTWSLTAGWRWGTSIARALSAPGVQWSMRVAGPLAGLAVGVAIPVVSAWLVEELHPGARLGVAIVAAAAVVVARWLAPAFGGVRFGIAVLVLTLVLGLVWR